MSDVDEGYEELLNELRVQLQGKQRQLDKLQQENEDREEEIASLRNDYRDVQDTNLKLEQTLMELRHQLVMKENEINTLRKKRLSDIKAEVQQEKEQLKEQLCSLKKKYVDLCAKFDEQQQAKYGTQDPVDRCSLSSPNEMHELLWQMVQQYELEIQNLRSESEETLTELQKRLKTAIADKEEIAEGYICEIERLDLALTEAVNRLTDQKSLRENKKSFVHSSLLKFCSLQVEIPIMNSSHQVVTKLPPYTEVVCSMVHRVDSVKIVKPVKYGGWVQLQSCEGLSLLEPVADTTEDDFNFENNELCEINVGRNLKSV